jgi:hypothetical protein
MATLAYFCPKNTLYPSHWNLFWVMVMQNCAPKQILVTNYTKFIIPSQYIFAIFYITLKYGVNFEMMPYKLHLIFGYYMIYDIIKIIFSNHKILSYFTSSNSTFVDIYYTYMVYHCWSRYIVSQPHFGQVCGWSPTLPKLGTWSPPGFPNV